MACCVWFMGCLLCLFACNFDTFTVAYCITVVAAFVGDNVSTNKHFLEVQSCLGITSGNNCVSDVAGVEVKVILHFVRLFVC